MNFDGLLSGINEEVTINDRRYDDSECLVFEAADMNNYMLFHDTSKGYVNEEFLVDNGRNDDDVKHLKMLIGIMN
jgi:hypothetical protein